MMYDVFISYSTHDQKVVEALCACLEQNKVRCFVAYRDIPYGSAWAKAIVEALENSRMMLVVFSNNYNNSVQVDREIEIASNDNKPILTLRITNDKYQGAKKYFLNNINWIDAFPEPELVFGSVVENVCKLLDMPLSQRSGVAESPSQNIRKEPRTPAPTKHKKHRKPYLWVAGVMLLLVAAVALLFRGEDGAPKGENYVETAVNMELAMVYVEGGSFQMGATEEQRRYAQRDEYPSHTVTLSSYYISATEITQGQWVRVMGKDLRDHLDAKGIWYTDPAQFGADLPMCYVSWEEAMAFCRELSRLTGRLYALPTEAQWEYAARGGVYSSKYLFSGGDKVGEVGWCDEQSILPVGGKKPNALGLYDMSGNVMEWCADWYGAAYYSDKNQPNPTGPESGSERVVRGGCWYRAADEARVAFRNYGDPSYGGQGHGFRVVCLINGEALEDGAEEVSVVVEDAARKPGEYSEPIGRLAADATKEGLLNMLTDEIRGATGADVVLFQVGGVRPEELSKGVVTMEDILSIHPFNSNMVLTTMTATEISDMILSPSSWNTRNTFYPSGLGYTVSVDSEGCLQSVSPAFGEKKELYVVAVDDYTYSNESGFPYHRRPLIEGGVSVVESLRNVFQNSVVTPDNTSRVVVEQ